MVADLCIKELFALVERGKMLVKMKSEVDKQQGQLRGPSRFKPSFVDRKKPYSRPPSQGSKGGFS